MEKIFVLFLCTGNSARSQMAEAILREIGGKQFEVNSAGLEPSVINPFAIEVLKEIGISTEGQYSKPISKYAGKMDFDYLITVCTNAEERCPIFPGVGTRLHWPFEDPAAFQGSDDEKTEKFREIRDQIKQRILSWLRELDIQPKS
jgi:arsenate reductase